jgi:hypothetical protein
MELALMPVVAVLLLLILAVTAATFLPTRHIARIDPAPHSELSECQNKKAAEAAFVV